NAKRVEVPVPMGRGQDFELQEIMKTFHQEPGEGILSWLVRVWDNAGNMVLLLHYELRRLGVMAHDSQVRAELADLPAPKPGEDEQPSLYRWLTAALGNAYPSVGELEAQVKPWKMVGKRIQVLRQLGMAWAVATGGTEGPDDVQITKSTKSTLLRTAPDELKPSLLAVVMAADGRVGDLATTLMQLGTALAGARPRAVRAAKGQPSKRQAGRGQDKGEIRVPRRVLWSDLLQAGVPREEIDGKPMADLHKRWMQLPAAKCSMGPEGKKSVELSPPPHPRSGSCHSPTEGVAGPLLRVWLRPPTEGRRETNAPTYP
uniref:Uncharacterized protein n=1 Tax=Gopherus agassizii TaxID=38772 RepID=A0A452IMX4_9SAUR